MATAGRGRMSSPRGRQPLGTADSTGDPWLWRTCPETQRPGAAKSTLYVRVPGAQGFGCAPGQDLGRGCGQGPAAVPTGPEQRLLGWRPHVAVGGAQLLTGGGAAGESPGQSRRLLPEPSEGEAAMLSVTHVARQHTAHEKRVAECGPAQGARDKAPPGETSIGECAACFKATSWAFWGRCGQQAVAWAGHRRRGVALPVTGTCRP